MEKERADQLKPLDNLGNQGLRESQTPGEQLEQQFEVERKSSDRHQLQIEFAPQAYEKLLEIRKKSGATTNAEVIRNGLRFYEYILDLQERGAYLQAVDGNIFRKIVRKLVLPLDK